jgi:hypothetical protein
MIFALFLLPLGLLIAALLIEWVVEWADEMLTQDPP